MIKKMLVIGLCSLVALEAVFPDVDIAELSHLPELFSHFQKHNQESPELSFSEFLILHYDDSNHLASTPSDHHNLPFSKRQHHRVSVQISQEIFRIHPEPTYRVIVTTESPNDRIVLPTSITSQVWQPPRA